MAFVIEPRSAWGAKPATGRTSWVTKELFGITQHHFGGPDAAANHAGCLANARSVQATHMKPGGLGTTPPRGGADIGYNFGVCPHGRILTFRGWNTQTGANGTTFANEHYLAIVYMANTDVDPFPEIAQDAIAWLYAQAFKKGVSRVVVPHQKWTGSGCPGDKILPWVNSGAWKKDLPSVAKVRWELWDDNKRIDQSLTVPIAQSFERFKMFQDHVARQAHDRAVAEGKLGNVGYFRREI